MLLGIVMAVLVMHSSVGHGDARAHEGDSSPIAHAASGSIDRHPTISGSDDCDMPGHPCVFTRDGDPVVTPKAVSVLAWGFPIPLLLGSIRGRRILRTGRPPPWVMPTHLQLAVIRC